jgi:carbon-monoxide dehydrogenase medium subunit
MIPATFAYTRAGSVDEALRILAGDASAKVIAGGQSLLPLMKLRLAHPGTLVDIGRLGELKGVTRLDDGRLSVGALTTYAELMDSPVMHYGVMQDALPSIGDVQVRNLGTVGGSIAHADPSSDLPAVLIALGAELVLQSPRGTRTVTADGFCHGPFTTGLEHDELLLRVILPAPLDHAGSAYASLEQPASGYALVGVAAVIVMGPDRRIAWAGIGVTGVHEHPYRAPEVEQGLVGTDGSADAIAAAVAHAGSEYRAAMARVYARRAIEAALARIG